MLVVVRLDDLPVLGQPGPEILVLRPDSLQLQYSPVTLKRQPYQLVALLVYRAFVPPYGTNHLGQLVPQQLDVCVGHKIVSAENNI